MAKKATNGGWAYGKNGSIITVSTPITADGKPAPYGKTVAGGLGSDVGFLGKFNKKKA